MSEKVKFPFGAADAIIKIFAAVVAVTIDNMKSFLTIAQMTGASTLNLTIDTLLEPGAVLCIHLSTDATNRVFTPGTGMTGTDQALLASKSYLLIYEYDGTSFNHVSTNCLDGAYSIEAATDVQAKAYAATIEATIAAKRTQITIATMTDDADLDLTIGENVAVGAKLTVFVDTDAGGATLTPGTGMSGKAQVLAASKSYSITYEYDGTNFVHTGGELLN